MIDSDTPPRDLAIRALQQLGDEGRLPHFRLRRRGPALVRKRGAWRDELVVQRSKWSRSGYCVAWVHVKVSRTIPSGEEDAENRDVTVGGGTLGRIRQGLLQLPEVGICSESFASDVREFGDLVDSDAIPFLDQFDDSLRCTETATPSEITSIWAHGLIPVARHLGRTDALERYYRRRAHADPSTLMHICRGLAAAEKGGAIPGAVMREAELLRDERLVGLIPGRLRHGWRGDERWPAGYFTRCPDLAVRTLHDWGLGHLADAAARLSVEALGEIERRLDRAWPDNGAPTAKSVVLELCRELGFEADPTQVWATGTVYIPPEPAER